MKGVLIVGAIGWVALLIILAVNGHDSTRWSLGTDLLTTLIIVSTLLGLGVLGSRQSGIKYRPWMFALGLGVSVLIFNLLTFGEEGGRWPPLAMLLLIALLPSPMYVYAWEHRRRWRHIHEEWLEDLVDSKTKLPVPGRRPSSATAIPWVLGGALLPAALGVYTLLRGDIPVDGSMFIIGFGCPMIGALAYELSPTARYDRRIGRYFDELDRLVDKAHRRHGKAEREKLEVLWLARLKDALYWWNTHGARLNSDDHASAMQYLEDHVRVKGPALVAQKEAVLRAFNDESDPCATTAAAGEMARWAVANRAELLKDRLAKELDRSVEGLTYILRSHHRSDYLVLSEADPALFAHAVRESPPLKKDESPEQRYRRVAAECDSLLKFKAQELRNIEEDSKKEPLDAQAEWKRWRTELLLAVVMHEMRRRMEEAQ